MIRNYIKVALRNVLKNRVFSFINIFGLAVSLSVCLLAILLIQDAHSFDKFHPEGDRTYRILTNAIRKGGGEETYASSPYMVGKMLSETSSQIEEWTPLVRTFDCDVQMGENQIYGSGFFTDVSFFEVFGFELQHGDPASALESPYNIVLTSTLAEKLFPNSNPLGQTLNLPAYDQEFKVSGVLQPFPGKTHLEFDALGSLSTEIALNLQANGGSATTDFRDYYMNYNFIRLAANADPEGVAASLSAIAQNQYKGLDLETRDAGYRFEMQELSAITPGPMVSNKMGRALPVQVLWFFSILSIIVIISACFNYTNLTIARSLTRAREIGVRKVMGATRNQVFGQFISESVLMALLALSLAYLFLQLTIPAFNSIGTLALFDITFSIDGWTILYFTGFAVLVGLLAGFLPALVLSNYDPVIILKQLQNVRMFRRLGIRKLLVIGQFAVSLIFVFLLTIGWGQVQYAMQENFGAGKTDILHFSTFDHSYEQLTSSFGQLGEVKEMSGISHLMGTWRDSYADIRFEQEEEASRVRDYSIDHLYLDHFDLKLAAGENFPENLNQQEELFVIVNEKFLERFDLGTAQEAIGKPVLVGDSTQLAIRGVVENFLFKPLAYDLEPLLLRYNPGNCNVMNLSVQRSDIPATIAALERTWKQMDSNRDFTYEFYDTTVAETYADMQDMAKVIGYFGVLALIIACLGLLGMTIYSVETKAREISIRKIVGADTGDLVRYLSKGFFWLLLIALVVAVPASFFLGQQLLQTFAYSIPLNIWVFLPGTLLLLILGVVTVGSQTLRAALANPVKQLKTE